MLALRVLCFLLGFYVAIRALAAIYGILDRWYAIGANAPAVLARLVVWCGLAAVAPLVLPAGPSRAFLGGAVASLAAYLANYLLLRAVVSAGLKRPKIVE